MWSRVAPDAEPLLAAKFLLEAHRLKRVILIAHEGCGFYGKHYRGVRPAELKKHQEDLRRASEALEPMGVARLLYLARIEGGA